MRKLIRCLYHNTIIRYILICPAKKLYVRLYYIYHFHLIPDKIFIKRKFKKAFNYDLNLNNPKTLNEKIQWLKLNDRTPLHTLCADKYAVREYVKEKIGEEYLVPLVYHTKNPADIVPENLPDFPFIIKTNHDCSGGIIVRDKSKIDWKSVQKTLAKLLKQNYFYPSREWQYKNIKPRIIVEKLLMDKRGNIPFDYKLHCIKRKVEMIQVDVNRGKPNHYRNWYNRYWKREPYRWSALKNGGVTDPSNNDIEKPISLEKMIKLSEILSEKFYYVRVDWYNIEGRLFFGELTFHHDGGLRPILPTKWDRILGDLLKLPIEE